MSQTLSLRVPDELMERIDRFARRLGNGTTRSRASVLLIDEALREEDFALIEFRNSPVGRLPYIKGSGMAVWEFILIAKRFDMNVEKTVDYLDVPLEWVKAAFNYYDVYREEIDQSLEDNRYGEERLKRLFPNLRVFEVPQEVWKGEASE
jgi:hypothetical protein